MKLKLKRIGNFVFWKMMTSLEYQGSSLFAFFCKVSIPVGVWSVGLYYLTLGTWFELVFFFLVRSPIWRRKNCNSVFLPVSEMWNSLFCCCCCCCCSFVVVVVVVIVGGGAVVAVVVLHRLLYWTCFLCAENLDRDQRRNLFAQEQSKKVYPICCPWLWEIPYYKSFPNSWLKYTIMHKT